MHCLYDSSEPISSNQIFTPSLNKSFLPFLADNPQCLGSQQRTLSKGKATNLVTVQGPDGEVVLRVVIDPLPAVGAALRRQQVSCSRLRHPRRRLNKSHGVSYLNNCTKVIALVFLTVLQKNHVGKSFIVLTDTGTPSYKHIFSIDLCFAEF